MIISVSMHMSVLSMRTKIIKSKTGHAMPVYIPFPNPKLKECAADILENSIVYYRNMKLIKSTFFTNFIISF